MNLATRTGSYSYYSDDGTGESNPFFEKKAKDSKTLIKECQWVLYTISIYLGFLQGLAGTGIALAFIGLNFKEIIKDEGADTEEVELKKDCIVGFVLFLVQISVFWYGIMARKDLTYDTQERFKNFMKAYVNLLFVLSVLFTWYCLQRVQIFLDDGRRTKSDYVFFTLVGQNFVMRIVEGRAAYLAKCFKKSETLQRYKPTHQDDHDPRIQL